MTAGRRQRKKLMFAVVTGGSGSGKSAYAEKLITDSGIEKRYYIATMKCGDEESKKRIARHRAMRRGKHFETIECPCCLSSVTVEKGSAVLLECMSNLVANEIFTDGGMRGCAEVQDEVIGGLERLLGTCALLVVVTNEVFSDGVRYDSMTQEYLRCLGEVNGTMAAMADQVTEVVYSIPVIQKKRGE